MFGALGTQVALGGVFLAWDTGREGLRAAGDGLTAFLALSGKGAEFVFGALADPALVGEAMGPTKGFLFAAQVLPVLIFFSSFTAVLYHLGVLQAVVRVLAWVMARLLGTSGAETLSATGNIFVGQTEAPLLVRPFLARMTMSEMHAVMTGGFATIAGSVFALYVGFGIEPGALVVASIMAAPGGLMVSKMLWPETEQSETMGTVAVPKDEANRAGNLVEAAASGASDGMRLALNVAAMLIAFLGLIEVTNAGLGMVGTSLEQILSYVFFPVAMLLGVPFGEVSIVAELLGTKLVATELIAYQKLGALAAEHAVSERTQLIASFALCGFANFGSLAIQIGGLGAMAPERRREIASLGLRTMLAGALTTCMTACVAGVLA